MKRKHIPRLKKSWLIFVIGLFCAVRMMQADQTTSAESKSWKEVSQHWYIVELGGATVGWMRETILDNGTQYCTDGEVQLKVSRGTIEIEITMQSRFIETHDGEPIELHTRQSQSREEVEVKYLFRDDDVQIISTQGDRENVDEHPLPEGIWYPPRAAERYCRAKREVGDKEITFRTLAPEYGLTPLTIKQVYQGEDEYELAGQTIPVSVWQSTNDIVPMPATVMLTQDGRQVYESVNMGIGVMVTRIAKREEALAAGVGASPELMINTFVKPDQGIDQPLRAIRAKYRVKAITGNLPELPSTASQKVEMAEDRTSAVITVDIDHASPAPPDDLNDPSFLETSTLIDSDDVLIRKLAQRVVKSHPKEKLAQAEALREFVFTYINSKSLDTAFATASETARMKTGDCSEHGVLLCALLRAGGIPARIAIGLVYVDQFAGTEGVFGWHMWTQALIDDCWVDLDATLPVRYHAGHILTGTSSMEEGSGISEISTLIMLIGNLEIEVLDIGYPDSGNHDSHAE